MTGAPNPWAVETPPPEPERPPNRKPPARAQGRPAPWLGLILALVFLVFVLAAVFSSQSGRIDWMSASRSMMILVMVGASLAARRLPLKESLRYALAWIGIGLVLALGYSLRSELVALGGRIVSEVAPASALPAGPAETQISESEGGQFEIEAEVNGAPIRFLVDTGASDTVLSPADARRLGIEPAALDFSHVALTANGPVHTASWRAASLKIAGREIKEVPMQVNAGSLDQSLLGMSFLRRLKSFRIEDRRMILVWPNEP